MGFVCSSFKGHNQFFCLMETLADVKEYIFTFIIVLNCSVTSELPCSYRIVVAITGLRESLQSI
jgi:hypothetical protein